MGVRVKLRFYVVCAGSLLIARIHCSQNTGGKCMNNPFKIAQNPYMSPFMSRANQVGYDIYRESYPTQYNTVPYSYQRVEYPAIFTSKDTVPKNELRISQKSENPVHKRQSELLNLHSAINNQASSKQQVENCSKNNKNANGINKLFSGTINPSTKDYIWANKQNYGLPNLQPTKHVRAGTCEKHFFPFINGPSNYCDRKATSNVNNQTPKTDNSKGLDNNLLSYVSICPKHSSTAKRNLPTMKTEYVDSFTSHTPQESVVNSDKCLILSNVTNDGFVLTDPYGVKLVVETLPKSSVTETLDKFKDCLALNSSENLKLNEDLNNDDYSKSDRQMNIADINNMSMKIDSPKHLKAENKTTTFEAVLSESFSSNATSSNRISDKSYDNIKSDTCTLNSTKNGGNTKSKLCNNIDDNTAPTSTKSNDLSKNNMIDPFSTEVLTGVPRPERMILPSMLQPINTRSGKKYQEDLPENEKKSDPVVNSIRSNVKDEQILDTLKEIVKILHESKSKDVSLCSEEKTNLEQSTSRTPILDVASGEIISKGDKINCTTKSLCNEANTMSSSSGNLAQNVGQSVTEENEMMNQMMCDDDSLSSNILEDENNAKSNVTYNNGWSLAYKNMEPEKEPISADPEQTKLLSEILLTLKSQIIFPIPGATNETLKTPTTYVKDTEELNKIPFRNDPTIDILRQILNKMQELKHSLTETSHNTKIDFPNIQENVLLNTSSVDSGSKVIKPDLISGNKTYNCPLIEDVNSISTTSKSKNDYTSHEYCSDVGNYTKISESNNLVSNYTQSVKLLGDILATLLEKKMSNDKCVKITQSPKFTSKQQKPLTQCQSSLNSPLQSPQHTSNTNVKCKPRANNSTSPLLFEVLNSLLKSKKFKDKNNVSDKLNYKVKDKNISNIPNASEKHNSPLQSNIHLDLLPELNITTVASQTSTEYNKKIPVNKLPAKKINKAAVKVISDVLNNLKGHFIKINPNSYNITNSADTAVNCQLPNEKHDATENTESHRKYRMTRSIVMTPRFHAKSLKRILPSFKNASSLSTGNTDIIKLLSQVLAMVEKGSNPINESLGYSVTVPELVKSSDDDSCIETTSMPEFLSDYDYDLPLSKESDSSLKVVNNSQKSDPKSEEAIKLLVHIVKILNPNLTTEYLEEMLRDETSLTSSAQTLHTKTDNVPKQQENETEAQNGSYFDYLHNLLQEAASSNENESVLTAINETKSSGLDLIVQARTNTSVNIADDDAEEVVVIDVMPKINFELCDDINSDLSKGLIIKIRPKDQNDDSGELFAKTRKCTVKDVINSEKYHVILEIEYLSNKLTDIEIDCKFITLTNTSRQNIVQNNTGESNNKQSTNMAYKLITYPNDNINVDTKGTQYSENNTNQFKENFRTFKIKISKHSNVSYHESDGDNNKFTSRNIEDVDMCVNNANCESKYVINNFDDIISDDEKNNSGDKKYNLMTHDNDFIPSYATGNDIEIVSVTKNETSHDNINFDDIDLLKDTPNLQQRALLIQVRPKTKEKYRSENESTLQKSPTADNNKLSQHDNAETPLKVLIVPVTSHQPVPNIEGETNIPKDDFSQRLYLQMKTFPTQ